MSVERNVERVAEAIDLPVEHWPGRCYGIAKAMLEAGLVEGALRYGFWLGPVAPGSYFADRALSQHGWVELPSGRVVDPTRWVFEDVPPYIYVGPEDYYDAGGNVLRQAMMNPAPIWDADEAQARYEFDEDVRTHVALLLAYSDLVLEHESATLSISQRFWLLTLPLPKLEPYAAEIYREAIRVGDAAIIPIDNRHMVLEE